MTIKPELTRRLFRFAVVGGSVAVLFMGLNKLFGLSMGLWPAYLLAYPPALALHYALNKWWTFGCDRTDTVRQVSEYLLMTAITFVVQSAFFWLAGGILGLAGWLSAGIANVAQMVLSFVIMQRKVFAGAKAGPDDA